MPAREPAGERRRVSLRQAGWVGFFMLALTDFVALNSDFLVVGHIDEAESLGLYSLAFTLAFAPLTQVSWQVGRVLFPAAAATVDLATVARRTLVSVRMMGLILLPFVPPAIVLAPVVLPGLLGDEWKAMVAPFQILLVVGVGQAMVGMIGESLSGTGNIGWRARVNAVWAAGMVGALILLVSEDGIRGAAWAHAALFVPLALAYAHARRSQDRPGRAPGACGGRSARCAVCRSVRGHVRSGGVAANGGHRGWVGRLWRRGRGRRLARRGPPAPAVVAPRRGPRRARRRPSRGGVSHEWVDPPSIRCSIDHA